MGGSPESSSSTSAPRLTREHRGGGERDEGSGCSNRMLTGKHGPQIKDLPATTDEGFSRHSLSSFTFPSSPVLPQVPLLFPALPPSPSRNSDKDKLQFRPEDTQTNSRIAMDPSSSYSSLHSPPPQKQPPPPLKVPPQSAAVAVHMDGLRQLLWVRN